MDVELVRKVAERAGRRYVKILVRLVYRYVIVIRSKGGLSVRSWDVGL